MGFLYVKFCMSNSPSHSPVHFIHVYLYMYVRVCIYIPICAHEFFLWQSRAPNCSHKLVYTQYMYIHMYIHICVCVCVRVCIHSARTSAEGKSNVTWHGASHVTHDLHTYTSVSAHTNTLYTFKNGDCLLLYHTRTHWHKYTCVHAHLHIPYIHKGVSLPTYMCVRVCACVYT